MPKEYFSATVLEHIMLAESKSFIEAIRTARSRMLEEDKAKDCSKAAVTGLTVLCGGLGVISIAVGAVASGAWVIGLAGAVSVLAKQLDKSSNHASIEGEQMLWASTDIKAWLTQAWQAGYPVGQVLTAYSDFCEEVYLSQFTQPKRHNQLKSAAGFVKFLNQSPDQFSGLPPVVKIGSPKVLPMPLEDEPVDFTQGFGQMLNALEDEPLAAPMQPSPKPNKKTAPSSTPTTAIVSQDYAKDDLWAEETVDDISKMFGSADQRQQWERNIQKMNKEEDQKVRAAIAVQEEFNSNPQKLHRGLVDVINLPACCVIYGRPGSGKGIQLSNAIREQKKLNPNIHIFAIDPKNDSKEDGYWGEGFDTVHRKNILKLTPNEAAQWVYSRIKEFHQLDGPRLLVWDEVMTCVAAFRAASGEKLYEDNGRWMGEWVYSPGSELLKEIHYWATAWISSGDSQHIRAWFITQSGNLDDLPFTGGSKTQVRQIILARKADEQLVGKMGQNSTIGKGKANMDLVREACDRSPVDRAIYISDIGEWLPLAKLPNHSGWDRDKQSMCTG